MWSPAALVAAFLILSQASPAWAGVTVGPPAFYAFCARQPAECRPRGGAAPVTLSPERLAQLAAVNSRVNASIREVDDQAAYGVADVWALPSAGIGDCEDFALIKRHQLMALGWPSSALLITVVRTSSGDGHAVLTVVTSEGDLILDNQTSQILGSADSGLVFFTRQSSANPRVWVTLPRRGISSSPGVVAAGTR